jgi:hypothetical protein
LKQLSGYGAVNGTTFGGTFLGRIFPSKLAHNLFQAHMLSYQEKRSEGCFVWAGEGQVDLCAIFTQYNWDGQTLYCFNP